MRKLLTFLLVVVVLPGGALIALALYAARRLPASVPVLLWSRIWALVYRVPYPLMAAVLANEAASQLRPARATEAKALGVPEGAPVYPFGDMDHAKGPAYGPGQVIRTNVLRLWGSANALERFLAVAERPEKLALPGYERHALWASVQVLREGYVTAKGNLHEAARRYNGSGERAEAYARRADEFRRTYG